jgi:uncharacterized protein YegL
MTIEIPDVALRNNKSERLPCVLIVDGSLSMKQSGAIAHLQEGLKYLEERLKEDDDVADMAQIAIIRMGGNDEVTELTFGFEDAADFTAPIVEANGSTPLGKAVAHAMAMIESQKLKYKSAGITYKRPWLWIMSDGQPTDEWHSVAEQARAAQNDKRFTVWAWGVGNQAPLDVLKAFTIGERCYQLGERDLKEMFEFMSQSMSLGSKSIAGRQMQLPPVGPKTIEL